MKPTADDGKTLSASYRATYRRHRALYWLPVLLGAAAAALILFSSSASYRSSASLWVDSAPSTNSSIGASGNSTLSEPPAASEQGILTELLTTDAFADSVVQNSLLGRHLSAAQIRTQAPRLIERDQVTSAATGEQILNVSYTGPSRAVTESVLTAILNQLRTYNDTLAGAHGQASVAYDQEQVKLAQASVITATSNLKSYLAHGGTRRSPTYLSLSDSVTNAVNALGQANTNLDQGSGSTTTGGWTIRVLDAPSRAVSHTADKKQIVAVILGGAFGGLIVSLLAIIALTPARREERDEPEEGPAPAGTREPDDAPVVGPTIPAASQAEDEPRVPAEPETHDEPEPEPVGATPGTGEDRRDSDPRRKTPRRDTDPRRDRDPRRNPSPRRERVTAAEAGSTEPSRRGAPVPASDARSFVLGFASEGDAR